MVRTDRFNGQIKKKRPLERCVCALPLIQLAENSLFTVRKSFKREKFNIKTRSAFFYIPSLLSILLRKYTSMRYEHDEFEIPSISAFTFACFMINSSRCT